MKSKTAADRDGHKGHLMIIIGIGKPKKGSKKMKGGGRADSGKVEGSSSQALVGSYARGGWIKNAHLKKGAFTAQADKVGKSVHEYAEEKKDAPGKTGKRARLALTFQKMAHGK